MTFLNTDTKITAHAAITTNVHGTGAGNVIVGDDELVEKIFNKTIGTGEDINSGNISEFGAISGGTWFAGYLYLGGVGHYIEIKAIAWFPTHVGITASRVSTGTVEIRGFVGAVETVLDASTNYTTSSEKIYALPTGCDKVRIKALDNNDHHIEAFRYYIA